MNRIIRVSVWASKVVTLGAVAGGLSCGGGSATSSTGSTNAGSGTSGGGSCSLAAGTYTIHYTVQSSSSPGCPSIPDETETVAANETFSNLMAGTTSAMDAGVNCSSTDTGCSVSETCSSAGTGLGIQISTTATVGTNSVNGQVMETITATGVSLTCNYAFTFTPG
jgi:hypothetical protein